jgi:hypothetical protein
VLSSSLKLDVHTHAELPENVEAARRSGEAIEKAVTSVGSIAIQQKRPPTLKSETLAA